MATEAETLTFLALLLPFAGAAVAPVLTRLLGHNAAWPLALVPALLFAHFAGFLPFVAEGGVATGAVGLGAEPGGRAVLAYRRTVADLRPADLRHRHADRALIPAAISKVIRDQGRFFSFILMFMGAMQGLVLADGFLMLFVFWELTSITSFLLIGFDNHARGRRAAPPSRRWSSPAWAGCRCWPACC